ncbi:MAG: hypothetical protein ACRBG0_02545 [Lewinella sp.]|jgi:hypothetical protein|uniref:hypothetical protein n=1 Tax=Lewinella sp. TaxID=2004506 RepID=UPI003D6B7C62
MTPEQEKQLLESIYDRLFDAITYTPTTGAASKNPFTAEETFIHFMKNGAINPEDFDDARTPSNPQGSRRSTAQFSLLVDKVSPMSLEWENSGAKLSEHYANVLEGANSTAETDPKAEKMYDKAFDFLNVLVKDPFDEDAEPEPDLSPAYQKYKANLRKYTDATMAYTAAYNSYLEVLDSGDEKAIKDAERQWQVNSMMLSNAISGAQDDLVAGNGKHVERALEILRTTTNSGIRKALTRAQDALKKSKQIDNADLGDYYTTYAVPSNWAEGGPNFTELKISGSDTKKRSSYSSNSFSVGGGVNYGLWKVKASAEGKFEKENSSTDKNSVEITANIAKVDIIRPWFSESIFRLGNWSNNISPDKGSISNGKIDSSNAGGYIPMYPVAFIVAKDIRIKADWSHEDKEIISRAVSGKASVSYGPFATGTASYDHKSGSSAFNADFQNGEIKIPGMQIIGWVSRLTPSSPK